MNWSFTLLVMRLMVSAIVFLIVRLQWSAGPDFLLSQWQKLVNLWVMPGDPVLLGQLSIRVMGGATLFFALWFLTIPVSLILFGAILVDMLVVAVSGKTLSLEMLIENHLHLYLFQAIFISYVLGGAGSYSIDGRLFAPSEPEKNDEPLSEPQKNSENNMLVTENIQPQETNFSETFEKNDEPSEIIKNNNLVTAEDLISPEKNSEEKNIETPIISAQQEEISEPQREEFFEPKDEPVAPAWDLFRTPAPSSFVETVPQTSQESWERDSSEEILSEKDFSAPISMEELENTEPMSIVSETEEVIPEVEAIPEQAVEEKPEPIVEPEKIPEPVIEIETPAKPAPEKISPASSEEVFVSAAAQKIIEENEKIQKKIQEQNQLIKQEAQKLDKFLEQPALKSEEKILIEKPLILTKPAPQKELPVSEKVSPAPHSEQKKHFKSDISKPWNSKASSPQKFSLKPPKTS